MTRVKMIERVRRGTSFNDAVITFACAPGTTVTFLPRADHAVLATTCGVVADFMLRPARAAKSYNFV